MKLEVLTAREALAEIGISLGLALVYALAGLAGGLSFGLCLIWALT